MKKQTRSRQRTSRAKGDAAKSTKSENVKGHLSKGNIAQVRSAILELLHQLETHTLEGDSKVSRPAFEVVMETLREVLTWLHTMAGLHPLSLGALRRSFPERDAWAKYNNGEHVSAWSGIELARLYRQILTDLRSGSKQSFNRLRQIRHGFDAGEFAVAPNAWFCAEYKRRADYRPSGKMAIWTAGKIEELRHIKENRLRLRKHGIPEIVEGCLRLRTVNESDDILPDGFRSEIVEGEALKRLDGLPVFGNPTAADFDSWRKFLRNRLLTSRVVGEFDRLFPNSRRKLDGVAVATLRSTWRAINRGGKVILP